MSLPNSFTGVYRSLSESHRFLQIDVRSLQSFLQLFRIGDGRGLCLRIRPVCSSYLAFAVGIRNLDNYLDLHTGAEWDLRRAKRAAGMRAALAKDFQKKFGGAIGDLVRFGKAGSAVDQYQQPDDT